MERLINKTSLSMEAEESILSKLKLECGINVINKMTKMIADMNISKDLVSKLKEEKG